MKQRQRNQLIIFGILVLTLLGIGTLYNSVVVPENRIPFMPVVDISIQGRELPVLKPGSDALSNREIQQNIYKETSKYIDGLADTTYQALDYCSFEELTHWMNWFYWNTPKLRYKPEAYDCDNYARTFVVFGDLAGIPESPFTGQLALFRIYVEQKEKWGGVPAGGYHALVMLLTDKGWIVYEPQSGAITPFNKYPNRNYILKILGD